MRFFIILFIIIFSNNLFPANFEFAFGGGGAASMEFSYVKDIFDDEDDEGGSRIDDGLTANVFLDIGANFELQDIEVLKGVISYLKQDTIII